MTVIRDLLGLECTIQQPRGQLEVKLLDIYAAVRNGRRSRAPDVGIENVSRW